MGNRGSKLLVIPLNYKTLDRCCYIIRKVICAFIYLEEVHDLCVLKKKKGQ